MDLNGKTAIVTGASSGIGAETARHLHRKGVRLVLAGRRASHLQAVAEQCGSNSGGTDSSGAVVVVADITDPETPARLLETAVTATGRCDIVFNNAGIMTSGAIPEIDIDAVCRMIRVNVEASIRMVYVALKHFKQTGSGHLISTSSVLGTKVRTITGAYSATKYAIEALTESLRMELAGTDIRVACVEPGLVMTDIHRDTEVNPMVQRGLKKVVESEDVARCVVFMLEQPAHVAMPRLLITPAEDAI
ncbi:MAG: SDR family oxidoreductase [bacterium]